MILYLEKNTQLYTKRWQKNLKVATFSKSLRVLVFLQVCTRTSVRTRIWLPVIKVISASAWIFSVSFQTPLKTNLNDAILTNEQAPGSTETEIVPIQTQLTCRLQISFHEFVKNFLRRQNKSLPLRIYCSRMYLLLAKNSDSQYFKGVNRSRH